MSRANRRRTEWKFLRNDLLAVKPNSKILHSSKLLADVNTFALGIDEVFEKHPYFDVVPDAEYDLQKDVLNAVLSAFERKAGDWCTVVSLMWQTFIQQVRSSTVEATPWNHTNFDDECPKRNL
jgi:hypothetical protein